MKRINPVNLMAAVLLAAAWPAAAEIQFLSPWWIATGTSSDTCALGSSIVGLGDINSDGYDDFAAGTEENRVWIFLGSSQPDSIPDLYLNNPDSSSYEFGADLHDIGDLNGDSYSDILIEAYYYLNPGAAKFFVYFAGAAFDTIPDLVLGPPLVPRILDADGIGDFNGDGDKDFMITDQDYWIPGTTDRGRMQVFWGGSALDSIPDWQIFAGPNRSPFPMYCTGIGDINDDGCSEVAGGSGMVNGLNGEQYVGLVEIYYGNTIPDTFPDWQLYGISVGEGFGADLTSLDIDHDNYKELGIYSARTLPTGYTRKIFFYDLDLVPDTIWDYFFGINNYPLGGNPAVLDFDGDSWDDLATGGAGSGFGEGGVNVFLGGDSLDPLLDLRYDGSLIDAHLGQGFGRIGDYNGDGIDDLAAGEPGFYTFINWPKWGRVHVILGNQSYHQSPVSPDKPPLPQKGQLNLRVHPNPFNSATTIGYELPEAGIVTLKVWDISGRMVAVLVNGWNGPGAHQVTFDGSKLSSGVYLYKLTAGSYTASAKMVLLK